MKKTAFILFASLALLCSCEKNLSDDGMAMRFDIVPGTSIKESQLGSKKYTEAEFGELVNGRCYKRIAVYDCYKNRGTYYVIMGEEDGIKMCDSFPEHLLPEIRTCVNQDTKTIVID